MAINGSINNIPPHPGNFGEDDEDEDDIEEISKDFKEVMSSQTFPPPTSSSSPPPLSEPFPSRPSSLASSNQINHYLQGNDLGATASSNIPLSDDDDEDQPTPYPSCSLPSTLQATISTTNTSTTKTSQSTATSPSTPSSSKIDNLKSWSLNTYKITKQLISERLGHASKTVDLDLETQIEGLRDTQARYLQLLKLAKTLSIHFSQLLQIQRHLGDTFSQLSLKNPELHEEFTFNCETQRVLCKNGELLVGALNFFISTLNTLCSKTIDDTLITIRNYEAARVEFDAYRHDLEDLQGAALRDSNHLQKMNEAQARFDFQKEKYDNLKADVTVKMQLLDENRIKVMHKQLVLLHKAVSSYFSGNQASLEETMKQFNIKLKPPNSDKPSWIENNK